MRTAVLTVFTEKNGIILYPEKDEINEKEISLLIPEHPRLLPAHRASVQPPGGRVGGAFKTVQVPPARLHPFLGHRRPRPPRPLPDQDAGPPGR